MVWLRKCALHSRIRLSLFPCTSHDCTVSLAEWDFGGFPPWLLTVKPQLSLRSSDPNYIGLVSRLVEGA